MSAATEKQGSVHLGAHSRLRTGEPPRRLRARECRRAAPLPCRGGEGRGQRACRAPCRPDSLDPEVLRSVAVPTVGEVS